MPTLLPLLAVLLAPAPAPTAPGAVDARLWELAFPVPAAFRETRLWSSFDRSGGNDDGFTGRFEAEAGGGRTLVDARGPGALVRVWSANPTDAPIELWHDDEPAPRRVVPFREWFEEGTSGGHVAYPRVPFERRLRVVARGPVRFHQWNTLHFDPAPPAPSPAPPAAETVDDLRPAKTWIGANGTPIRTFAPISFPLALGPGQGLRAELRGAGAVTRLIVDARSDDPAALRRALLRIRVDGEESPRVEAPLADFFAIGGPGATIDSAPFAAADGRLVCRFVVPFGDGLRLDLVSHGRSPLHADVRMEGVRTAGDDFDGSRFHARFRHTLTEAGAYVDLLRAEGSGRVVGTTMTARGPRGLTYLEGDEQALVDGRGPERYHGTGTEDFFNCGWYFASGVVHRPFHGVTWKEGGGVSAYRFLIEDPIPFHRSITFRIEHGGGNDEPGVEIGAVTYWYADRGATHDFEPLEPWMLAPPRRVVGYDREALHARSMERLSGFEVVPLESLDDARGGPRYVSVDARSPAAALRFAVDVADRYRIVALHARGPDGGRATLSTTGIDRRGIDGRADAFEPIVETSLGAARFDRGTHPLVLAHGGGGPVRFEGLRLEPELPFVRAYEVRGAWPLGEDGRGFDAPLAREEPWRPVEAGGDGFLPLAAHVSPNQFVVADARFAIEAASARRVTLRLGSDDWLRVFVNGDEVHRNRVHRAPRPDQDLVEVALREGTNEVVLRVANEDGGYGLFCRVSDPEGGLVIRR